MFLKGEKMDICEHIYLDVYKESNFKKPLLVCESKERAIDVSDPIRLEIAIEKLCGECRYYILRNLRDVQAVLSNLEDRLIITSYPGEKEYLLSEMLKLQRKEAELKNKLINKEAE